MEINLGIFEWGRSWTGKIDDNTKRENWEENKSKETQGILPKTLA